MSLLWASLQTFPIRFDIFVGCRVSTTKSGCWMRAVLLVKPEGRTCWHITIKAEAVIWPSCRVMGEGVRGIDSFSGFCPFLSLPLRWLPLHHSTVHVLPLSLSSNQAPPTQPRNPTSSLYPVQKPNRTPLTWSSMTHAFRSGLPHNGAWRRREKEGKCLRGREP